MTGGRFPGGTSVTLLEVYDSVASDGLAGGSPHLHLASTECYIVLGGRGGLQLLDASGYREVPLREGSVIWFTPGTIHRAVNVAGLRVLVLMGNAGLPEAGDAVMTFPPEHLRDRRSYGAASSLAEQDGGPSASELARRRRDLAVDGFLALRRAAEAGDPAPYDAFIAAAAQLVRVPAQDWTGIVRDNPLAQAAATIDVIALLEEGRHEHLRDAVTEVSAEWTASRALGMCGWLRSVQPVAARNLA